MSALMAEPRDVGRQETLFDALAPPRTRGPAGPWTPPPERDVDSPRDEATVSYLHPRDSDAPEVEDEPESLAEPEGYAAPSERTPGPDEDAPTGYAAPDEVTPGPEDDAFTGYAPPRELAPRPGDDAPAGYAAPAAEPSAHDASNPSREDTPRGAAPVVDLRVSREDAPPTNLTGPQGEAAVVVEREVAGKRAPRVAGAPLAGPTLDDVMSRVWEGLATGLPAACPVCHHEVLPVLGGPAAGRCTSCGTVID